MRFVPVFTLSFVCAVAPLMSAHAESEGQASGPTGCRVTHEPVPAFVPPGHEHDRLVRAFYFGTGKLWVVVYKSPWRGLPLWDIGYRDKIAWGSEGYDWMADPKPALAISGNRLDASAPPLVVEGANGASSMDMGSFIMSGVNFPTKGCWEITGRFKGAEVKFVVSVE